MSDWDDWVHVDELRAVCPALSPSSVCRLKQLVKHSKVPLLGLFFHRGALAAQLDAHAVDPLAPDLLRQLAGHGRRARRRKTDADAGTNETSRRG